MPFHLWITPDDEREFFGIRRWNIDEERLLSQFVEPYRTGLAMISSPGWIIIA